MINIFAHTHQVLESANLVKENTDFVHLCNTSYCCHVTLPTPLYHNVITLAGSICEFLKTAVSLQTEKQSQITTPHVKQSVCGRNATQDKLTKVKHPLCQLYPTCPKILALPVWKLFQQTTSAAEQ